MRDRRDEIDAWAETHVLEVQPILHVVGHDSDNLALYDEYVRELARAEVSRPAEPKSARGRRKR